MKTKTIEVTVTGETGTGKSEVLQVIHDALREFYANGKYTKIAGEVPAGAIKEAQHTGQTAKGKDTVIVLRENNVRWRPRNEGSDYD